jgi:hypothetical protein
MISGGTPALVVSSIGALVDSSSSDMLSKYRSGRASVVPASAVSTNTSQSGVQSPESVVATLVGEYSSAVGVRGAPF